MKKLYHLIIIAASFINGAAQASHQDSFMAFDVSPYACNRLHSGSLISLNVETESAVISVLRTAEIKENCPTIVFLHSNSACKELFIKQFDGLAHLYNVIAMDLPGHGQSTNAFSPQIHYSLRQVGTAVHQVMQTLGIKKAIISGWSLGGHIAMEMMDMFPSSVEGIFITGSPPVGKGVEFTKGFKGHIQGKDLMALIGKETEFSYEEAKEFMEMGGVENPTEAVVKAAQRTHGLARKYILNNNFNGTGMCDEKALLKTCDIPVGIIMGTQDNGINNEFIKESSKSYRNLVSLVEVDSGHATLWEAPEAFNSALLDFVMRVLK